MKDDVRKPTISVITANFNHGHLIEAAISSVANQSREVLEHIIVDDASTDNSRDVIRALMLKYPFVRMMENERNMGPAPSVGRAIHEARGEYIQFLSADDVVAPDSIAKRLSVVDGTADKALICGDIGYIDLKTGKVDRRRYINVDQPVYIHPLELVEQQRRGLNVVNGGSSLARREDLLAAKIDVPALKWHHDTIAFNAIAYRRGVWYVPGIQNYFTIGKGNYSRGSLDWNFQKQVLSAAFDVLAAPDFSDVYPHFRDSGVLAQFPLIIRFLMRNPRYRDFFNFTLIRKSLAYGTYRGLKGIIPQWVIRKFIEYRTRVGKNV